MGLDQENQRGPAGECGRNSGGSNMSVFTTRPSRRLFMGGAAAGLAAPFVLRSEALGQSTFDWKRFNGTKLDIILVKNPRSDLLQAHEKEFTALTGIQVSSEQIPEQQQRQKAMIEFSSGRPTFDVCMLALHVQKRLAAKGKWMDDLRPYMADASLTSPGRWRSRHFAPLHRFLDGLLQQGDVRAEGCHLPQNDG
jgi:ABC-type glycerol-3-phosphate transport system substrate-binding protein